jgi:large subunit ribosomal protein L29
MAKSSFKRFLDLTEPELEAKSRELRQELFNLRLQKATARLEKPHRLREIRRDIARCETRLTQVKQTANATPSKA